MKTLDHIPRGNRTCKCYYQRCQTRRELYQYIGDKIVDPSTGKLDEENAKDIYDGLSLKGSALKVAQMLSGEKFIAFCLCRAF